MSPKQPRRNSTMPSARGNNGYFDSITHLLRRNYGGSPLGYDDRDRDSMLSVPSVSDSNRFEELQRKLDETTSALYSKALAVDELQGRFNGLKSSLNESQTELEIYQSAVQLLKEEKARLEAEIAGVKSNLSDLQTEHAQSLSQLGAAREQLGEATRAADTLQKQIGFLTSSLDNASAETKAKHFAIQSLEEVKAQLEAECAGGRESLASLQAVHADCLSQLEALQLQSARKEDVLVAEHAARVGSEQSLKALQATYGKLEASHSRTQQALEAKSSELDAMLRHADSLTEEVGSIRAKREEDAQRICSLEAELTGLEEDRNALRIEHDYSLERIRFLDQEIMDARAELEQAVRQTRAKEAELRQAGAHSQSLSRELDIARKKSSQQGSRIQELESSFAELTEQKAQELQAKDVELRDANVRYRALSEDLDGVREETARQAAHIEQLKADLVGMTELYSQAQDDARAAEEEHLRKLKGVESDHQAEHSKLSEEVKKLQAQLQAQEKHHMDELEVSNAAHCDDIATLLAEKAEQERINESSIREIKELQAVRDIARAETRALEAELAEIKAVLRATEDELSQHNSSLSSATHERHALKKQLDEARKRMGGKDAIIEGLSTELSHARDAHAALRETFLATDGRAKELEELARSRDEEVVHLRAIHHDELAASDAMVSELRSQCDAIRSQLDELEGINASLKSRLEGSEGQVANSSRKLEQAEKAISDTMEALATASQEAESLRAQLTELRQQFAADEKAKSQEISRLSKELSDVKASRAALGKTLNVTKERLSKQQVLAAEDSAKRREEEFGRLRAAHQSAINELHAKHRGEIQQQVKTSLQEIERRDAELSALRGELSAARSAARAADEQVQAVKAQFDLLSQSATELETTNNGMITDMQDTYRKQVMALQAEKAELQRLHGLQMQELRMQHERVHSAMRSRLSATGVFGGFLALIVAFMAWYL
ncbi:uncharacterized protein LAESUDRAFT_757008 [Laetiporus sulphureus 93-53]|uniref:Uncharacterized protein n=1 Tax=Laetiporus sulphureus 93-53 TaxID=1314785 RepID=A0A165FTK5_9APHY|nr:uncharacterized protein LAESUDRAFT_757008 [Laetiporus sulphureus 93-53]KZT09393.1 hypothetical protein LAESUDRAFT_757008 [Laetiporus sulphureus 93-53]